MAVIDSGSGVSDEATKRLFTPFSTTKKAGMGLGLSISQSIIVAHGGQLQFHNNESSGATFSFSLPAASLGTAMILRRVPAGSAPFVAENPKNRGASS